MKIVFVVNNAAFFVSHRLPVALAAQEAGHDVQLITGRAGSATMEPRAIAALCDAGLTHHVVSFDSAGMNPLREARGLFQVARLLRSLQPDLVHCVSPKGVLYGGLAARLARVPALVMAVSGLGYLFSGAADDWRRRVLRAGYLRLAKIAFSHPHKRLIVQNHDDLRTLERLGLVHGAEVVMIPGSGVDLAAYQSVGLGKRENLVVLPGRLLRDKGVLEFAEAAVMLRKRGGNWRFVLAGAADYKNPSAISEAEVRQLAMRGVVEWPGYIDDMPALLCRSKIVCLPSYAEGMPKALLEAAAAGCAVVTTDVPGCREAIVPGQTGLLVPPRDASALADALWTLMTQPELLDAFGTQGQTLARQRFGIDKVIAQTLAAYHALALRNDARRAHAAR